MECNFSCIPTDEFEARQEIIRRYLRIHETLEGRVGDISNNYQG